jgi:inositol oxygenase
MPREELVMRHYTRMRTNQTVDYVTNMEKKYLPFEHAKMSIWEAFEQLDKFVDASDPDTDHPNLVHMMQTAEAMRAAGHPDWFQLIGLLHDLGKLMFLWGDKECGQECGAHGEQWGLAGDTWVVGCRLPDRAVLPHLNELNPDMSHPVYGTKFGMYEPGCGLANLKFAWGHDEYMYRMLKSNNARIPEEGLMVIRLHSCYPWHREGEYREFMAPGDELYLQWVQEFNKFDLYTKADTVPDVEALKPYYQSLIDKYIPGVLRW